MICLLYMPGGAGINAVLAKAKALPDEGPSTLVIRLQIC